ncbi:putative membrane protein [Cryptosporidium felis]|nr:putative membrane protein [Cryptosporidium felis]
MVSETPFNFRKHKSDLRQLSLIIFILVDLIYAGVLTVSIGKACDTPLKTWLIVAILLSYPATKLVAMIESKLGKNIAIICETIMFLASFLWFTMGTVWVNTSLVCQSTAPALWWTTFVTISSIWFFTAGLALSLIGITVFHMVATGGSNPEFSSISDKPM